MRGGQQRYCCVIWIICILCVCLCSGCAAGDKDGGTLREIEREAEPEEDGPDSAAPEESAEGADPDETGASGKEEPETLYVHVCGHVLSPGVYELPAGSRLYEAIGAAGGTTGDAAGEYLNQAELLSDGQQVYVPSVEEAAAGRSAGAPAGMAGAGGMAAADDGKVDINTASKEELMTLNGIGEAKAEAIIRYREEHGGFSSIEDIKKVNGIKDAVFNTVKEKIKVS